MISGLLTKGRPPSPTRSHPSMTELAVDSPRALSPVRTVSLSAGDVLALLGGGGSFPGTVPASLWRGTELPQGHIPRAIRGRSVLGLASPFFQAVTHRGNRSAGRSQNRIRSRITHRHFAIFRSRSNPNSSNRSAGPVWK
jgi:hypothetical protein